MAYELRAGDCTCPHDDDAVYCRDCDDLAASHIRGCHGAAHAMCPHSG